MKQVHKERAGAHLDRLVLEYGIDARAAADRMSAESNVRERMIFVPELREVCDYLITLHEIGHIVDPQARIWDKRARDVRPQDRYAERRDFKLPDLYPVAMMEMAAWAWAHQTAKRSLLHAATDDDWQVVADCLVSWFR